MFLTTLKPNVLKEDEVKSNVQINIDWVSYGAVSPAKNEGSCLEPWKTHSTTSPKLVFL